MSLGDADMLIVSENSPSVFGEGDFSFPPGSRSSRFTRHIWQATVKMMKTVSQANIFVAVWFDIVEGTAASSGANQCDCAGCPFVESLTTTTKITIIMTKIPASMTWTSGLLRKECWIILPSSCISLLETEDSTSASNFLSSAHSGQSPSGLSHSLLLVNGSLKPGPLEQHAQQYSACGSWGKPSIILASVMAFLQVPLLRRISKR